MKPSIFPPLFLVLSVLGVVACLKAGAQTPAQAPASEPASEYRIYAGNTHSHTSNTWSHGAQWQKGGMEVIDGVSHPKKDDVLKPNWEEVQGTPARHFALAKANGFDFYAVTDHSQEAAFHPTSPTNPAWLDEKRAAAGATGAGFVAIAGFEHSENDGPDGKGHINVFNSATYLNALDKGIDLHYLYKWLPTAQPNGDGPVVASFNHPGLNQYNDWDFRTPAVTEVITMFEVLNSSNYKKGRYDAFVRALDKGWKVAPVSGIDNHGTDGIKKSKARTFVLATEKTKAAILDAMKHRRTYAALDQNIQCRYTVNGRVMGSTLDAPDAPGEYRFDISISDPDVINPKNKITKIDIVTDGGKVVRTYEPKPAYAVRWSPVIADTTGSYFFVRVWSAGGGDTPGASPEIPVAWLAPVWTGRPASLAGSR